MVTRKFTVTGPHVSDVFQEVEEELRRDKAAALWKRYGSYIAGLAVAIVAGTGIYVAWRDYTHKQASQQGAEFFAATALAASGDRDKAIPAFDALARNASSGYAVLARMREASLKAESGDRAAAAAIYRAVADDSGAATELRDAARLLAGLQTIESMDPAELDRQLAALRADGNPWRHTALEMAAIAATKAGDAAKARELFARIADDPTAPTGARGRAAEMIAALGT
jgi:hypothetical protein